MQVGYTLLTAFVILMALFAFGYFHYYFVPKLDKSAIEDIVKFIAEIKSVKLNPELRFPVVNEVDWRQIQTPDYIWRIYGGLVSQPLENYFTDLNRIWLREGCRQNWLIHALVHYVQFNYDLVQLGDKEKEFEAWEITRLYIKSRWPLRYRTLSVVCFGMQWWTSEPN